MYKGKMTKNHICYINQCTIFRLKVSSGFSVFRYNETKTNPLILAMYETGARCSSVVRVFAHGAIGRRIDPSWGGPIELFLVPASAPRLV